MQNEDLIAAGDDPARAYDDPDADAAEADGLEAEPEMFDLEVDGQVHSLPIALKGAVLRHADYTRKTQELAEHRRAVEAERHALAQDRRAAQDATGDRATLMALERQLEAYEDVDWQAFAHEDPDQAQALWETFQETQAQRDRFAYALSHHESREEMRKAREAAEAMAATGAKLRDEIDGWSPEVASKLVEYAQVFGVTMEELSQAADPRLWKLLHKAWRADQSTMQDAGAQAIAVRPAVTVAGGGAGGGGMRDELGTREWMRRRNEQMARGR
ncbi:MAG TPA: hypothetical protein VF474_05855 [Phenylobacterium sp.]